MDAQALARRLRQALAERELTQTELARQAAKRAGDEELEQRAERLLTALRGARGRERPGMPDRFIEWDALR